MIHCDHCQKPFEPTRHGQRFHNSRCRSAWHRENNLPGKVTGIRALKHGWAVTVRYQEQPSGVVIGTAVRIETSPIARLDASTG